MTVTTPAAHSENAFKLGSGFPAGADLEAVQDCFVRIDTSGNIVAATAGQIPDGVLYNDPDSGQASTFSMFGVVKIKFGGTVAIGDILVPSTGGKAIAATSGLGYAKALTVGADGKWGYALLFPQAVAIGSSGIETVTSGALSDSKGVSLLSVTGTQAYTLPNGLYLGQTKVVECSVAATVPAGTLTITDAYSTEPTSYVFNTVGQRLEFIWTSTGWKLQRMISAGTESLSAAATANPLNLIHLVNVNGVNDYIQPSGVVPGQRSIWVVTAGSTGSTVSGLFYTTAGAATGVDLVINAASDMAVISWDGSRWMGENLVSVTVA